MFVYLASKVIIKKYAMSVDDVIVLLRTGAHCSSSPPIETTCPGGFAFALELKWLCKIN